MFNLVGNDSSIPNVIIKKQNEAMDMKKNIIILCVIIVLMSCVCHADSFVDDTSTEFDLGIYHWTAWKISDVLLSGELPDYGINSAVDTTGLVGLWHLNDKVEDYSRDNHGQAMNGADTVAGGKIGRAGSFDGVEGYLIVDSGINFDAKSEITIELWVNPQGNSGADYIISLPEDSGGANGIDIRWNGTHFDSRIWTHSDGSLRITSAGSTDIWYHLTLTYDGTTFRFYKDGNEAGNDHVIAGTGLQHASGEVDIARFGSFGAHFNGQIDEVAIYNRALTADEINQTYQRGLSALSNDITDGRVAFYKMDEPSWTQVQDTSGNDNDGTINGPVWTTGKLDTAMSFDGVDDWVEVVDDVSVDISDELTIGAWVKLNTLDNTAGSRQRQIIVNKFWASGGKRAYEFMFDDTTYCGNKFQAIISSTASTWNGGVLCSDVTPTIDTWYHVVLRFKANEFMEIWMNGENHTGNFALGSLPSGIAINDLDLRIGHDYDTGGYFNGTIDEVSIWNRSLSADEIQAIYNAQKDNYPSSGDYESNILDATSTVSWQNITFDWNFNGNLVGKELPDNQGVESEEYGVDMSGNVLLMHMDEATGTIVDTSGSGNDGTAVGGVTYGASGKFDKALKFDGVDGYVDVDTVVSDLSLDSVGTVSGWIYFSDDSGNPEYIWSAYATTSSTLTLLQLWIDYADDSLKSVLWIDGTQQWRWEGTEDWIDSQAGYWHYVNVVQNGTSPKIYWDGVDITTTQGSMIGTTDETKWFKSIYTDATTKADNFRLGCREYSSTSIQFFNGLIDEVAIFNRALSADEILNHYKRGALRLNISAKSCNDANCDGETTWGKTCTSSPCDITTLTNNQYIQYKVNMQSDGSSTPELASVSVFYGTGAVGCIDNDADGWGDTGSNLSLCNYTASYDCNDASADINPNAYDIPNNGIDEDCSGADAYASYEAKVYFEGETSITPWIGYYIGDDVYYEVNFFKNNVSSEEDVVNIVVNLTDVWGNVLKSQSISDMAHPNTGNWTGMFTTHDISSQDDEKVNLKVYVYNSGSTLLDWRTHGDEFFKSGTIPSFISTAYTYLTNAISNHTVKDLVVNSSEAKIDWSESTLDLHSRDVDLDSALTIGDRSVYLDSAAYSELNDSATLIFYNVDCASPFVFYSDTANTRETIFAENNQCLPPRCTNIQCAGNTLTVTVSSFTGYAAEADANLTIDADDPKFIGAEVHFTADYRNVTDDNFISGANCTIYFTDGNYPMAEGSIYTYNRTFVTKGLKDYNVTCSKPEFSTLTAFDNATIVSAEIPEFSMITLGIGLVAVLAGLIIFRKKRLFDT